MKAPLVLASASPRRADLLRSVGYRFTVRPPEVDERPLRGEPAAATAERLAAAKAAQVARALPGGGGEVILAADTVVALDRIVLGKPRDAGDARAMLRLLSGRTHRVITGLATCCAAGGRLRSARATTWVTFSRLTRSEIDWYVSTGDPLDKAGAYGLQGGAGLFVSAIRGSCSNVVGLPLDLVYVMLGLPA